MEIKKHGLINKFAKPTDNNEAKATPAAQAEGTDVQTDTTAGFTLLNSSTQKVTDASPSTKTGVNTLENALAKKGGTSVEALMSQAKEGEEKDGEKAIKPAAKATTPAAKATTVQTKEEAGLAKAGYTLFDSSTQNKADESLSKEDLINNIKTDLEAGHGTSVGTLMSQAKANDAITREDKEKTILPVQQHQEPHPAANKEPHTGEHHHSDGKQHYHIVMKDAHDLKDTTISQHTTHGNGQGVGK